MKVHGTPIQDLLLLEPKIWADHRGWFMESFSEKSMETYGQRVHFVQQNHSYSAQTGTLRGLHYQSQPRAQTKLVRCTRGEIWDVAVDLRQHSDTYLQWHAVHLSEDNKYLFWIPKGFAHGFLTLQDHTEVQYLVDEPYDPSVDCCIRYDDSQLNIVWPVAQPILSDKDRRAPYLADITLDF